MRLFEDEAIAIGKPIRRIGEVLMRLANGNTSVAIPYTDRGDEIGDTARVAGIFKDNLLRIGTIEAEQKSTEQRQLAERKSAMLALADTFEATIGEIVNAVSSTSAELQTAASTLTESVAPPTSRVKFWTERTPTFNVIPVRFATLNPDNSTVIV